jgi:hypothetical protein
VDEARRWAEASLALRLEHDLFTSRALTDLGRIALLAEEFEEARRILEEDRAVSASTGFEYERACATRLLAEVARREGALEEAHVLLDDALRSFASLRDVAAVAGCLRDLALLLEERGEPALAGRLWSAGTALASTARHGRSERMLVPLGLEGIGELPPIDRELTLEDALALAREADR